MSRSNSLAAARARQMRGQIIRERDTIQAKYEGLREKVGEEIERLRTEDAATEAVGDWPRVMDEAVDACPKPDPDGACVECIIETAAINANKHAADRLQALLDQIGGSGD